MTVSIVHAGVPVAGARRVAVLVHGRDQDEQVMLDVARRLALPDVAYVLPVCAARSWYPGRYFDPVAANEPHLTDALTALEAAATSADPGRTVIGGFSQGACLIAELVARRPRAWAGAAVLTGALLGPAGEIVTPVPLPGLPMFFGYSRHDEWVAADRAHATASAFAAAGARVTEEVYDDTEHRISDRAVAGLRRLLGE